MSKQQKQIFSLFVSVVMILSMFAGINFSVSAEDDILSYLTWEINNGEVTITDCDESISGDIVIPDTIEGYPVTILDFYAFSGCGFKSITIPSSVKEICDNAFDACCNLECVTVDESSNYFSNSESGVLFNKDKTELLRIPTQAIGDTFVIPDGVTKIADYAFYGCGFKRITFSESVSELCNQVFYECNNLEYITVSENNKYYSNNEFGMLLNKDQTYLICIPPHSYGNDSRYDSGDTFIIPKSVTGFYIYAIENIYNIHYIYIHDSFESWCSGFGKLSGITVDENNAYYSSDEYGVLFNKDKTQLMSYPGNNSRTEYIIPESVKMLGSEAFTYSSNLKELTIPAGLTDMGNYNFVNCKSIENFIVDKNNPNYTSDENGVLYNKDMSILMRYTSGSSRTEYTIPENVMAIWAGAFVGCKNLKCVTIPVGVVGITKHAFRECPGIEKLIILNPDCELLDNKFLIDEGITIYGYVGSTAQAYAETYNRKFVAIDNEVCYHMNTETINFAEPDCKNNGYTGDVYCNDCEEIIENGETVPATDHNYIENIIKEPTFTQPGLKNDICENCGDATAEVEIPQLTIEDSEEKENTDTDISIIYPDGTFDSEIEVEVTPVEEGEAYKLISHKQGNYKVTMFDINITVDDEKVQPNGTVLVKIPLPNGYNPNKCAVYYVSDDGTMEELTTYHYKDGYVYFETDHFSYYAILETVENTTPEEDNTETSMSFFDRIIAFFKKIIEFIKNLFA